MPLSMCLSKKIYWDPCPKTTTMIEAVSRRNCKTLKESFLVAMEADRECVQ